MCRRRFDIWLDPFEHARGDGYQVAQSLFAPGRRRAAGRGLGRLCCVTRASQVHERFPNCGSILPAPHTDFIYAVIVNELGLFGGAAVVLIYALITERGFETALWPTRFSRLLATA